MEMSEERMKALLDSFNKAGRTLEELLETSDPLKGAEAQKLRSHCTSYALHPVDSEDHFEWCAALMTANLESLKKLWSEDVEKLGREKTLEKWENYRDSPNKLPLYDILQIGAFTSLSRDGAIRPQHFEALEWLIEQGISVEGTDVAGYTALQHSLTCTPLVHDLRWSQILLDASSDPIAAVNHMNRYGATGIHETMMCYKRPGEEEIRLEVLEWALARGANLDIPDNDLSTPRATGMRFPSFLEAMERTDLAVATDGGCAFCRRGAVPGKGKGKVTEPEEGEIRARLRCSRCRHRVYCSAGCQKMDWLDHKRRCKPPNPAP